MHTTFARITRFRIHEFVIKIYYVLYVDIMLNLVMDAYIQVLYCQEICSDKTKPEKSLAHKPEASDFCVGLVDSIFYWPAFSITWKTYHCIALSIQFLMLGLENYFAGRG